MKQIENVRKIYEKNQKTIETFIQNSKLNLELSQKTSEYNRNHLQGLNLSCQTLQSMCFDLTMNIKEMHQMFTTFKEFVEFKNVSVPLKYYCVNEQIKFEYNGYKIEFRVYGDYNDNHYYYAGHCGKSKLGYLCPLILILKREYPEYYSLKSDSDLILVLNFDKQNEGKEAKFDFTLPSGKTIPLQLTVKEGFEQQISNCGMKKKNGTCGNLYVVVHLE